MPPGANPIEAQFGPLRGRAVLALPCRLPFGWNPPPCVELSERLRCRSLRCPTLTSTRRSLLRGGDAVWRSLVETLDRFFSRPGVAGYARLVRATDHTASGPRPLAEGSTLPGFRVVAAVPGRELVLQGRHHFSSYALIFRIEPVSPGRSRIRAESRAVFPGLASGLYRRLVIETGGHAVAIRRLLAAVRHRAE